MTIAVGWCESPFGLWRLEATSQGVRRIVRISDAITSDAAVAVTGGSARTAGAPLRTTGEQRLEDTGPTNTAGGPPSEVIEMIELLRSQLDSYFAGDLRAFELPLDLSELSLFARRLTETLASVPYGRTVTYAQLAAMAGAPRATRAVGAFCKRNPFPIVVPCHRVVRSDGTLGGYALGVDLKRRLLQLEGASCPANPPKGPGCAR